MPNRLRLPLTLPNRFGALLGAGIHIGLSKSTIAVVRFHGWGRKSTILADHPLAENALDAPERLTVQCGSILANSGCAGLPLHIVLADEWIRLFMVIPPRNTGRILDIHAAAAMRFQSLYGDSPAQWHLQADWQVQIPFLACAMPRTLLAALLPIAQENKLHLISLKPRFVAAWNAHVDTLDADCWFGVIHDDSLTLGAITPRPQQRLQAVRTIQIPTNGHGLNWLQEQITRIALQLNMALPSAVNLLGNQFHFWGGKTTELHSAQHNAKNSLVLQIRNLEKPIGSEECAAIDGSAVSLLAANEVGL